MRCRLFLGLTLAGAWSLVAVGPARSEPIPVGIPERWSYATARTPSMLGSVRVSDPGVVFTGEQGTFIGSHQILAANVLTFSNFSQPVVLDPSTVYETIFLRDSRSGKTGALTFGFTLGGQLSDTRAWLALVPKGTTSQTLHLGQFNYTVSVNPFRTPEDPSRLAGRLFLDVTVRHNPEPSSLILAGLGLSFVGAVRGRKRLVI